MAEDFYNTWLGVAPGSRPPNHYQLLGVALWCDDPAMLEQAARAQLAKLDRYAIHQDPAKRAACNRLMNEVATARVVLASLQRRAVYDRDLSRRLGIAMPAAEVAAAEVVFDDDAEQEADTDAEAYLSAIASAAGARKRRRRPAHRNTYALPIALAVAGVVLITGLSIWLFWQPSGQHEQAAAPAEVAPADQTPVAPPVVSRPRSSLPAAPPVMGKLFGLAEGQPPADQPVAVAPSRVAPSPAASSGAAPSAAAPSPAAPSAPTSSPSVKPASQPAVAENLAKPIVPTAGSGPVAWTSQMNALSDWTVVRGDWQTTSDGRILGKGDSQIDFNQPLPQNVAISFRLRVLSGMRPRVKFGDTKIYVGNEGYAKDLMVHGKTNATGHPVPYELSQEMAVRVMFLPDDQYSIRINDHVITGKRVPTGDGKITVQVLAGDRWSKGSTEFWDFKVGAVSVVDRPAVTIASAGPADSSNGQTASTPSNGDFITDWHIIAPFPTEKDTTRGLDFMTPVEDAAGFPGDGSIDLSRELIHDGKSFDWRAVQISPDRSVNMLVGINKGDWSVGYGYAEYKSIAARDTILRCGSDDGIKIWINGVVVHKHEGARHFHPDDDQAPIHLRAGINHVLVKCDNYVGNWDFCVAIDKPGS